MRAFESGKGFFQSLWDTIKNTLKTQVLKVMVQGVMGTLGVGASGAAMAGGGGTDILGLANIGSSLSNVYTGVSNLVTIGAQTFAGTMSVANALGTVAANATGTGISGLLATNGAYGTAAAGSAAGIGGSITAGLAAIPGWGWALMGAAAIAGILKGHGETRSGATYDTGADGLARYQQGPSGGEIAGTAARDLFNAAKTGIQDTLKLVGSSATITGYTAGLESSGKGKGFAFAGGYIDGKSFGDSDGREGHVSGQWAYQTMNPEQAMAAYVNELKKSTLEALQAATDVPKIISDQLAGVNINALDQAGLDTLVNTVSGTINAVNGLVGQLNTSGIAELHDLSFDAAYGLIQFAGGMEALGANLGTYYTNFYREDEQRAQAIKNIDSATGGVLEPLLKSLEDGTRPAQELRDAFRAIVEEQDLTTESGQRTYAALIGVSGAFAELTPVLGAVADAIDANLAKMQTSAANLAIELMQAQGDMVGAASAQRSLDTAGYSDLAIAQYDANTATRALIESTLAAADAATALAAANLDNAQTAARDAMAALQRAVDAQRKIYQVQAEAAQGAVTEIKSIFDTLDRSIKTLYGQVDSAQSAAAGRAFISNALANAQATGYLPDSAALGDAVQAAMNDSTVYASQAEADFAKLALAGTMGQLKDLTGDQLTTAEKQLQTAKDQLTRLDDTLVMAQRQLDAANGINTSVLSVADAVKALDSAIRTLAGVQDAAKAAATGSLGPAGGGVGWANKSAYAHPSGVSVGASDSAMLTAAKLVYQSTQGGVSTAQFNAAQAAVGGDIYAATGWNGDPESFRAKYGFAVGTNYVPYDMTAQIHEGEAIVPKAYNPAAGGQQSSARLERLVEGLTAEVKRLQAIVNDGNKSNERIASTLDNVTEGGANMRTVTT
jgi:hypothetical protein